MDDCEDREGEVKCCDVFEIVVHFGCVACSLDLKGEGTIRSLEVPLCYYHLRGGHIKVLKCGSSENDEIVGEILLWRRIQP
jgi:hypothetical protein